jgi:4-amino-4-deoxy-L-arabinose transferase-like glycosyltransferase
MLGALISFLFAIGAASLAWCLLAAWRRGLDPAEAVGLCGLLGLGAAGLLILLIGLIPSMLAAALGASTALAGVGLALARPMAKEAAFRLPQGWRLGALGALALAALFALVGALGPSDMNDWDSIAYHLAVPKLWLEAGQIEYVPSIHHSNFPGAVDNLFLLGMWWGGEAGAKAFSVAGFVLGLLALFGLGRRRYGEPAGWLAAVALAGVPAALWEAGTAYIDVGHGLFAGLGILYAAEAVEAKRYGPEAVRAALCLAFACASKYTGLQTLFAVSAVLLVGTGSLRAGVKAATLAGVATLALAGPWYARNVANTGNPVYPFFHEVFGGENWDEFSSAIYREEQQTFGVGRKPADLGAAILGLAYQPGRYTNPAPREGHGMPSGALGFTVVAAWLVWLASGRSKRFEWAVLGATGISLLMWFFLSQQSRYLITLAVPAAILAGGALPRLRIGPWMAGAAGLQLAASLYVSKAFHLDPKLPVLVGKVTREDYLSAAAPFSQAAQEISRIVPKDGLVALYDEVFGYYLDVPYFWANPGHSTRIPYARVESGGELADALRELGFTHIYVNTSLSFAFGTEENRTRWLEAAGLSPTARPYTKEERAGAFADLRNKWRVLVAEAIAAGRLRPVQGFRTGILFLLSEREN